MNKMLARLGAWLVQKTGAQGGYTFLLDPALVAFAEMVVKQVEADLSGASGENKRHRAFAILRRKMPAVSEGDTSKAIEVALDRVG